MLAMRSRARMSFAALFALALLNACAIGLPERERLLYTGRYHDAERLGEREIAGDPHPTTAKLHPLCTAYAELRRYAKLFPCLDRLQANIDAGDRSTVAGNSFIGVMDKLTPTGGRVLGDVTSYAYYLRAEAYLDLGRYDEAEREAGLAFAAVPPQGGAPAGSSWIPQFGPGQVRDFHVRGVEIRSLAILGVAQALSGKREAARASAVRLGALNPKATIDPFHSVIESEKLIGLTRIHMALGEFPAAFGYIRQDPDSGFRAFADLFTGASLIGDSSFATKQLPRAYMLSKCLLETGDIATARDHYDRLLATERIRDSTMFYWMSLYDRGRIAESDGDVQKAIEYYRRAIEVIEAQRASIASEASRIGFAANKQSVYAAVVGALIARGDPAEAFGFVERAKSRALVDLLATKRDFAVPRGDREAALALLRTADAADQALAELDATEVRSARRSSSAQARDELRRRAPELATLVSVSSLSAAEVQARLPGDETLVEYFVGADAIQAFVVTNGDVRAFRLDARGLGTEVRALRRAMQNPASRNALELAGNMYRRLVAPLAAALDRPNLVIVAHGPLHYVPFGALHDGRRFLLERFAIRMLPSASVLAFLREGRAAGPANVLALGNPDLGDPARDLAQAGREARFVAATMPASRALLRTEASESAFRRYAPGFRYLHFATHGEFDSDRPLESALLLAKDHAADGLLTVDDLYSQALDADLVTLSACETGLGKVSTGDDVVGLTRGFLYAGARSVVASLWQVDDRATAELMAAFYANLARAGKREALRQAQLTALAARSHPFYWAAFELTGRAD